MAARHLAAVSHEKGAALSVEDRTTPTPGPNDILIEAKAIAVNPADRFQRDLGMPPVLVYPAVFGADVAGLVKEVGSAVKAAPRPGSRVIAFASSFYQEGKPDYGAFQQYVLAPSEAVILLPDNLSYEQGATLPLAVLTALTAYTTVGIALSTRYKPQDKQAILIWGAASSVGTMAVQSAKSMGFTVYATASARHHEYIKTLGAHAVFDYEDDNVVSKIIKSVKHEGDELQTAHVAVAGGLQPTLDVLAATKGKNSARVAHSPLLPEGHPTLDNTEIKFTYPGSDKAVRDAHIADCFHGWLADGLKSGTVVPSPPVQIEGHGLKMVDKAVDTMKEGVSCKKIVVTL